MEIGGSGATAAAMQLMQSASQVRTQTVQQLEIIKQKGDQAQGEVLQTAAEVQTAAAERKSNTIDVMA